VGRISIHYARARFRFSMFVYLGYVFVSDGDAVDTGVSERELHCLAIFTVEAALAHKSSQKP